MTGKIKALGLLHAVIGGQSVVRIIGQADGLMLLAPGADLPAQPLQIGDAPFLCCAVRLAPVYAKPQQREQQKRCGKYDGCCFAAGQTPFGSVNCSTSFPSIFPGTRVYARRNKKQ